MIVKTEPRMLRILGVLCVSSLLSLLLLGLRMAVAENTWFSFLIWNLFLAWLPLLFALGLQLNAKKQKWLSWQNIVLSIFWLSFLPNSFYLMSDLMHIHSSPESFVLYDAAMILSFVCNGMILGYISTYIVHVQLLKRLSKLQTAGILSLVFLACGFAIYLGRYLRWNTWDILFNPAGLLFDLSERFLNPLAHAQTYWVTFVYALLIGTTYAVIYELIKALSAAKKD